MITLTRPRSGRMIAGVAIGVAECYRLPVTLVRVFFIVTVLVSPIIVLLYLLLAISMPDEENIASLLRMVQPESELPPRERFERFSKRLLQRLVHPRSAHVVPATVLAVALLFFAAILELPRAEGDSFYWLHPFLTTLYTSVSRFGAELYYLVAAALFLFGWKRREANDIVFQMRPRSRFALDASPAKMIGGVASGLSRVIGLDAAYIRVILIILNFLTLGLVGAGYLLVWFLERSKINRTIEADEADSVPTAAAGSETVPRIYRSMARASFRVAIAILLLLLAAIHLATEFRIFFFNEPFAQGIVMGLIGIGMVWYGLDHRTGTPMWLLAGASIFFAGIYFFASAIGNIQIASVERFEIVEMIGAISLAYAGVVALRAQARTLMLWLALIVAISVAMIIFHILPLSYLTALVRFYDFFYPIIFAGLGLWIAFER
ncbi:MAG TPA: PspC domain-containing protein [Candidatus Kapabacteria bacterium]|nr:PspC domain-containing protein [Candidatus Kapabacteria bacterium]